MATILSDNIGIQQAVMSIRKALHVLWMASFFAQAKNSENEDLHAP